MKTDILHTFLKWVSYNRWLAGAMVLVMAVLIFPAVSCSMASKTFSPFSREMVTRNVLDLETADAKVDLDKQRANIERATATLNANVRAHNSKLAVSTGDLDRQDEQKQAIIDVAATVAMTAASGAFNPASLIPIAFGMLGGAYGIGKKKDGNRKDETIVALKAGASNTT